MYTFQYKHTQEILGETIATTRHLINRCQLVSFNFKTLKEVWFGKPIKHDHLQFYGCVTYVRFREDKLEPMALKFMFLGYPSGVKVYKLWYGDAKKSITSKDVTFK